MPAKLKSLLLLLLIALISGCATVPSEPVGGPQTLTQGVVQMNLTVNETTKAEVLETFGAPNVTTRDSSGREVWSYQRQAQVTESSRQSSGWSIFLAGSSQSASGFSTSSRMMTLIIKFNDQDIVSDFRSRASNF